MSVGGFNGPELTRDLEALKLWLTELGGDDLPENDAEAIAGEISAIRLHLKRLRFEREALAREADLRRRD
jgi:hypothetical protein